MAALDSPKSRPAAKAEGAAKPFASLGALAFWDGLGTLDLTNARGFLANVSRCPLAEEVLVWVVFGLWAVVSECADAALLQALSTTAKAMTDQYGWVFRGGMRGGCWHMSQQFKRRVGA